MKVKFTVGIRNVRSLWQAGTYAMLKKELERFRYDVVDLCEVRWTGSGELEKGKLLWSGTETEHIHGVGMIFGEKARRALIEYNPVNDRSMYARFKGYPRDIIVIVAYAPTTNHSDDEVETFYEQLKQTLKTLPKKDVKIIVGDWNAKIGSDNIGFEELMGKYGVGDRNDRGESPEVHLEQITRCQNRFIRILLNLHPYSHVGCYYPELKTLNIKNLYNYHVFIFVFMFLHYQLPTSFNDFFEFGNAVQSKFTRHSPLLYTPPARITPLGESLKHTGPGIWEKLPVDIKTTNSLHLYKNKIKKYLLKKSSIFI
ncbi:hypothetical protein HELRODRAFT_164129 [Helobdella robusta]|uniref:Endonuclease/exonuclease/phosphatase domain-containing protein n=1 Tax=Helobdella robusta TaxID=6412 RepID=T1EUZ3_HELRO|nr:hypothetical protein HELRODRAFT_164129 [Helobdella robusta]ESN94313.1 hypothetical protein HELRODRAFT_164129 [Helobdella robusta]